MPEVAPDACTGAREIGGGDMKNWVAWLTAWALVLAVTGCSREASDWEHATQERSVETVQTFIDKHSDGEHADEARSLLVQVQAEQSSWEQVSADGGDIAFRAYIEQYPESRHLVPAQSGLDVAVKKLVSEFKADSLVVAIDPPYAVWRGTMAFAMGEGGMFTGRLTFVPPDPTQNNVAIAVLKNDALIPGLEPGRAYIWRGGTTVIDWQDVSAWDNDDDVAEALGFDPNNAYLSLPPTELLDPNYVSPE